MGSEEITHEKQKKILKIFLPILGVFIVMMYGFGFWAMYDKARASNTCAEMCNQDDHTVIEGTCYCAVENGYVKAE